MSMISKIAALVLLLLIANSGLAQPYQPVYQPALSGNVLPGTHEHDGFYLRLALGGGYTKIRIDDQDTTIKGSSAGLGIAVGGMVSPNFGIFGEILGDVAVGPEIETGGSASNYSDDVSAGLTGVGVGVIYYFMPTNVYVSGTISASRAALKQTVDDGFGGEEEITLAETESGPGLSLMVGKEWWVSRNWGLGIAGRVFVASLKDEDTDADVSASAFAIMLSATYN